MQRKILLLMLMFVMLCVPKVQAEQPAAEQYRKMFKSGNFYVEYAIYVRPRHSGGLAGKITEKMPSFLKFSLADPYYGKEKYFIIAGQNGNRVVRFTPKAKYPNVMYKDKNYYRFLIDIKTSSNVVMGFRMKRLNKVIMLPEDEINSPVLDPNENWNTIRNDLSLPEELAVFYWDDPYANNPFNVQAPKYNGSSKRTITIQNKTKEYDCDQYVNYISTVANTNIAMEAYNMLYENGQLVMTQKYFIRDGKEELIRELIIKKITSQVPETAFAVNQTFKIYEASKGDMHDLLDDGEPIGEIGGKVKK